MSYSHATNIKKIAKVDTLYFNLYYNINKEEDDDDDEGKKKMR